MELAAKICDEIANSDTSLRRICAKAGMPARRTVLDWLERHEEFRAKYVRAREAQADVVFDEMGAIEQQTRRRKVASDVARVVLQSMQWRAAKLANKKYGDRLELKHAGTLTLTKTDLTDAELEAIAAGGSAGAAGPKKGESQP